MVKKRVVGGIRLSSMTEETTSPQRQREMIQNWTDRPENDAEIVGWATDLDVSAGIPPRNRPELGQWMDRPDDFDVLAFAKLDRAVRSLNDFVDLDQWGAKQGVSLVILDPPLDLTDMWGRAMAQVLAVFAELERGMIRKRTKEGYDEILKSGRWPGGSLPYGYRAVRRPGLDGWYLEIDEEQARVLRTIINRVIGGASVLSQVDWLNEQQILTSRGTLGWNHTTVYQILRSRSLLGQWDLGDGEVLRDDQGMPVQRAEPIISRGTWDRLQTTLDANSRRQTGVRKNAAPLLRVAFCVRCERPLYRRGDDREGAKGDTLSYRYYRCASVSIPAVETCPDRPYRARQLESLVFGSFLTRMSGVEVQRRVFVPGEDHTEDLETAQGAYRDLSQQITVTRSTSGRKRITEQLSALDERIAFFEGLPNRPSQWTYEGTGETYAELWGRLNDAERGALLRESGVMAFVARKEDDTPVVALVLPEDLEKRAQEWVTSRGETNL